MRLTHITANPKLATAYRLVESRYLTKTLKPNHKSTGEAGKGIYVFFRGNHSALDAAHIMQSQLQNPNFDTLVETRVNPTDLLMDEDVLMDEHYNLRKIYKLFQQQKLKPTNKYYKAFGPKFIKDYVEHELEPDNKFSGSRYDEIDPEFATCVTYINKYKLPPSPHFPLSPHKTHRILTARCLAKNLPIIQTWPLPAQDLYTGSDYF